MKRSSSKTCLTVIAAILGLGLAQTAAAHDQAGSLTLAAGTKATDYYVATCFSDPNLGGGAPADNLFFQIKDTSPGGNLVGMTVVNNAGPTNLKAATTIDSDGSDAVYSTGQQIQAGNGDYLITVFHTGAAATESYTFIYHCQTANGTHTGTSINRLSNQ